jgi:ABC-type proline/glycine betaine transport system permease subunit
MSSALDRLTSEADDASVSNWVQDFVVVALWIPPILILFGIAIAILGVGVRTALYGDLPDLSGVGTALDSQTALLALGAAILGLYWLLARTTFGGETVDQSVESGVEAADQIEDVRND